jgi:exodeoxyribonuclease VII small subunit
MTPRARKSADTPAAPAMDPEIAALGYEQARDALVDVVRRLESGGATLEESLQLWERGEVLATRCEQWLHGARVRLDAANGTPAGAARPHQPVDELDPDAPDDEADPDAPDNELDPDDKKDPDGFSAGGSAG